jgi:predicted nucleic acid-binding protein
MTVALRYLLDTNICIYIAKRRPVEVARHFAAAKTGEMAISVITYGELLYGAAKSQTPEQSLAKFAATRLGTGLCGRRHRRCCRWRPGGTCRAA